MANRGNRAHFRAFRPKNRNPSRRNLAGSASAATDAGQGRSGPVRISGPSRSEEISPPPSNPSTARCSARWVTDTDIAKIAPPGKLLKCCNIHAAASARVAVTCVHHHTQIRSVAKQFSICHDNASTWGRDEECSLF